MYLKSFIQTFSNLSLSIYLRNLLGVFPKYYKEPPLSYSASDLFFWRSDEVWRTRFNLLNLPSVLYPKNNYSDRVTLIFYNSQGQEISRHQITILPLQTTVIEIEDLIGDTVGYGSMACFHEPVENSKSNPSQFCIVERGFIAYRRVKDDSPLWSYVHGAAYALAKPPAQDEVQNIRRILRKNLLYQPQLSLSDCDRFDLIYINPNDSDLLVKVRALDQYSQIIQEDSEVLPPRGVRFFSFDNKNRAINRVENESQAYMWRPFILKYYETHFDIFHG
jgi:hypothetical protein